MGFGNKDTKYFHIGKLKKLFFSTDKAAIVFEIPLK